MSMDPRPRDRADTTDIAALLHATDASGRVAPLAYVSQRLILRNQTLGGIDATHLVADMAASPAAAEPDGRPPYTSLIDAIGTRLSAHERARFADALDAANITDGPLERGAEIAADWVQRTASDTHRRISDGMADTQRRLREVGADAERTQWERDAAALSGKMLGKAQYQYGSSTGAMSHVVNTLGDFVDLAQAGKRFATDADYRDLMIGTAKMYAAEVAEDPRKPLTDAQAWARKRIDQWQAGLDKARAEGREAEYLGDDAGRVGIEIVATLVPVSKLGKFGKVAEAFDKLTPDNVHVLTEHMGDVGRALDKGGASAVNSVQTLHASMAVSRQQGHLLQLVEAGRATGNLDAMLGIGQFRPDELSWLLKHDPAMFTGRVSFDEALSTSTHGIDPLALSATAAGRRRLGDMGEAVMTRDLVEAGYTDIVSIQNKSGHGIDLVGRQPGGELEFFEVKTSARGAARGQYGDPDEFVTDRLRRAMDARSHWAEKNVPEGLKRVAEQLRDEVIENGGNVSATWVRLNLSREPGSPRLHIERSVEPWQARPGPARQTGLEPAAPKATQGPFHDPWVERAHAALLAGDSQALDRIALEFTQSPEGERMIKYGDELYAQQQLQEQQLQDQIQAQTRSPGRSI